MRWHDKLGVVFLVLLILSAVTATVAAASNGDPWWVLRGPDWAWWLWR